MKICFTIAEYNPLHYGHIKHLEYIKKVLGAEKTVVIMSGNFTQRGEPALLNKFTRAKLAIEAGADAVIELPTVFACANAETFARGGINIIKGLGISGGLCFGVESGEKNDYLSLAKEMNNESKEFKKLLKAELQKGVSLAKAKFTAVKNMGGEFDEKLISSPNNILGLEYTKAILSSKCPIDICPMKREGDHNDLTLYKGITSASSIREAIKAGKIKKVKKNMPKSVYKELTCYPSGLDKILMANAITTPAEKLKLLPDCTEGLENRIKALIKGCITTDELVDKVSTKRYTATRIKRILTGSLLGITKSFTDECLKSNLYAKVLAVKADDKDILTTLSENASIPIITRKSDVSLLKNTAKACYDLDACANDLYDLISGEKTNENQTLFI